MIETCRKHVRKHKESQSNVGLHRLKKEWNSLVLIHLAVLCFYKIFLQISQIDNETKKEEISCENNGALQLEC